MLKEYTCREKHSSKSDTKLCPIWRHSKKPEHQCYQRGHEKIMFENTGDTPKEMNVNIFFLKYFIDIWTCTTQLFSEPSDRTPLVVKCAFNKSSCMNHTIFIYTHLKNK